MQVLLGRAAYISLALDFVPGENVRDRDKLLLRELDIATEDVFHDTLGVTVDAR